MLVIFDMSPGAPCHNPSIVHPQTRFKLMSAPRLGRHPSPPSLTEAARLWIEGRASHNMRKKRGSVEFWASPQPKLP